ncbi:hypothetical protein RB195_014120 [Necator americanus]|uniref:Uncharacterized protein n=1 Tax=Necator americanus TaxID=51031 RepID=A0ABR1DYP1_NECAM
MSFLFSTFLSINILTSCAKHPEGDENVITTEVTKPRGHVKQLRKGVKTVQNEIKTEQSDTRSDSGHKHATNPGKSKEADQEPAKAKKASNKRCNKNENECPVKPHKRKQPHVDKKRDKNHKIKRHRIKKSAKKKKRRRRKKRAENLMQKQVVNLATAKEIEKEKQVSDEVVISHERNQQQEYENEDSDTLKGVESIHDEEPASAEPQKVETKSDTT